MAACIVCNELLMPEDLRGLGNTTKLQSRLARVLGEMVPVDAVMCSSCQCDLSQIEMYYKHLTVFKKRYAETAKQRMQLKETQNDETNRNLLHETVDFKSNDLQSIFGAGNSEIHSPMDSDVAIDPKIFAPFVKIEIIDVRTVREEERTETLFSAASRSNTSMKRTLDVEKASTSKHTGIEQEHFNFRKTETTENLSDGFEDNAWESDIDESLINTPKLEVLDSPSDIPLDDNSGKVVKKRGRPRKTNQSAGLPMWTTVKATKKNERPRKVDQPEAVSSHEMVASSRKCDTPKNTEQASPISMEVSTTGKRKRGRPRKGTSPKIKRQKKRERSKTDISGQSSDYKVVPVRNRPTRKVRPVCFEQSESEESSVGAKNSEESDEDDPSYDEAGVSTAEDSESDADDPDFGLEPLKKPSVPSRKSASVGIADLIKEEGTEGTAAGLSVADPQPTTSQDTVVDGGAPIKKKIGRPRKIVVDTGPVVKRPRGRPRKDENNPNPSTPSRPKKYYNKPQTCQICQKVLCSWASYKIHMAYHSEERPFLCPECGMGFKTSSCLNRHVNIHRGERRFKCKVCGRACLRRKDLEKHMSVHSNDHPYQCDQCERSFKLPEYLKVHIKLHHVQGKQFLCSKCGYATYTEGSLRSHMVTHTEKVKREKPWKCEKCDKCFTTKARCQRHEETHIKKATRDKHHCHICGKTMLKLYYLKLHIKQHTGDTNISCSICKKSFTAPSGLRLHMMAHRGETPLKCSICNKGFRLTTNLKVHMMMHTDERPWKCEICDLKFRRKPNLKDHLLTKKHKEAAEKAGMSHTINATLKQLAEITKPLPGSLEQPAEESKAFQVSLEQPAVESETLQGSLEQQAEESKQLQGSLEQPAGEGEQLQVSQEQPAGETNPLHMSLEQPTEELAECPIFAPLSNFSTMSMAGSLPIVIAPSAIPSQDGLVPYMHDLPNEDKN